MVRVGMQVPFFFRAKLISCSRTMILADDPSKRHMCPVTIFLPFALADGVVEGVQRGHHLASTDIEHSPTWKVMKYKPGLLDLPVMRRATNNFLSPLRALAPKHLHKMMQAQLQRAGHAYTFKTICADNKKAAEREKKRRLVTEICCDVFMLTNARSRACFPSPAHAYRPGTR